MSIKNTYKKIEKKLIFFQKMLTFFFQSYIVTNVRAISSAGRAFGLHPKCRRFDPVIAHLTKRLATNCESFFLPKIS